MADLQLFTSPGIYEYNAKNRSFKTGFMAWQGYVFLLSLIKMGVPLPEAKKRVLVNCPTWNGQPHIVNYPHTCYYPFDLYRMKPFRCFVMTDQGEQFMDARRCGSDEIEDMSFWNYQAQKLENSWHFDTVRQKNIDPRVGLNPTHYINLWRWPPNINLPLQAVIVKVLPNDNSGRHIDFTIYHPQTFYPLWNSGVPVERKPNFRKHSDAQVARMLS